jgi:hypothetical protein
MPDLHLGAILTAIVTPFDAQNRVNEESFVALMHHLAENGSDGFVVAATTGEASTLSDEEQLALIELAVAERPAGKTIVAGTGTNDTRHAVFLTERATELGADAMISVTPYYNRPSPLGLRRHYEAVAAASDKPILLYNIPSRTGTNIGPELLAQLAQIEGIDGVKQANAAELQLIDGLALYAGDDTSFARREPHRRQRDAPDARRARASRRDRRLSARRLRDAVPHLQPHLHEGRSEHAGPRRGRLAPAAGGGHTRAGGCRAGDARTSWPARPRDRVIPPRVPRIHSSTPSRVAEEGTPK